MLILNLLKIISNSCDRETPILYKGKCESSFCTDELFSSGDCKIDNDIIKTQWLNNIIFMGNEYSAFTLFGKYSNGDIIIFVEDNALSPHRFFMAFKKMVDHYLQIQIILKLHINIYVQRMLILSVIRRKAVL